MSRSSWKSITYHHRILLSIKSLILKRKFKKKIFYRHSAIPSIFNNKSIVIYNGSIFNKYTVNEVIYTKKFGEFSLTRKPFFFPKKKPKTKR